MTEEGNIDLGATSDLEKTDLKKPILLNMVEVHDLKGFANLATEICSGDEPYWFRGVRDAHEHALIPSLYRYPDELKPDEFRDLEGKLMGAFRDRGQPFHHGIPSNPTELLFFMQHHGAPTRLLDWTENPFIALFFALEIALWQEGSAQTDSVVWVLRPKLLNKIAFNNNEGSENVLSSRDDLLNAYNPGSPIKNYGKLPIAIHGAHNSPRIVAQRGVFVLFGSHTDCMSREPRIAEEGALSAILVRSDAKRAMAKSLFNMGITDSVVYPDLDGLGREIKNRFKFWRE